MKKNYFEKKENMRNVSGVQVRRSENKAFDLGLKVGVDPIHIKNETIDVKMEDCAFDMQLPSIEVEGKDVVVPINGLGTIKLGGVKVKIDLGSGRANEGYQKEMFNLLQGVMNIGVEIFNETEKIEKLDRRLEEAKRLREELEQILSDKNSDDFPPVE